MAHHLPQPVDIKSDTGHALTEGNEFADLGLDIPPVVLEVRISRPSLSSCGTSAGDIERKNRNVIHAIPNFRPLDISVAGVGKHGDGRFWDAAHGMLPAAELNGNIGLHVTADIRRVAVVLGLVEIFVCNMANGRLE